MARLFTNLLLGVVLVEVIKGVLCLFHVRVERNAPLELLSIVWDLPSTLVPILIELHSKIF